MRTRLLRGPSFEFVQSKAMSLLACVASHAVSRGFVPSPHHHPHCNRDSCSFHLRMLTRAWSRSVPSLAGLCVTSGSTTNLNCNCAHVCLHSNLSSFNARTVLFIFVHPTSVLNILGLSKNVLVGGETPSLGLCP